MNSMHVVIQVLIESGYKEAPPGAASFPHNRPIPKGHYYYNGSNYLRIAGDGWDLDVTINHQEKYPAHIMLRRTVYEYRMIPGPVFKDPGVYESREEVGFINFCKPDSLDELKGWLV